MDDLGRGGKRAGIRNGTGRVPIASSFLPFSREGIDYWGRPMRSRDGGDGAFSKAEKDRGWTAVTTLPRARTSYAGASDLTEKEREKRAP